MELKLDQENICVFNLQSYVFFVDNIVFVVCFFVKEGFYCFYFFRIFFFYCLQFDIFEIKYCVELVKSKSFLVFMLSVVFGFIGI